MGLRVYASSNDDNNCPGGDNNELPLGGEDENRIALKSGCDETKKERPHSTILI